MSAHLFHHGKHAAHLGYIFNMTQGMPSVETTPSTGTSFTTIVLSHDPVLAPILRGNAFVDLGLSGFGPPPSGFDAGEEFFPTPVHSRKYDSQFDERRNASILLRITDFLHSGLHPRSPNLYNENLCIQSNYRGSATIANFSGPSSVSEELLVPFGLGHYGIDKVKHYDSDYIITGVGTNSNVENFWVPTLWHYSYQDWLRKMSLGHQSNTDPLRYTGNYDVDFFEGDTNGYGAKVSCSVQFFGYSPVYCTYRWSYILVVLGCPLPGYVQHPTNPALYQFGGGSGLSWSKRLAITGWSVACDVSSQDISIPNLDPLFSTCYTIAKSQTLQSVSPAQLDSLNPLVVVRDQTYRLGSLCYRELSHLKDANYLSTVDSVETMQRGTNSDILQTLSKLPDAASMIPKINEFISLCEDIHHKHFDITTLKDLVGLAATTNLQSNFQWQPFQRFITEQLPEVVRGIVQGWNRDPFVTGRGKFSYSFPGEFLGFPSARLTARSKIVVDTGLNSAFAMVLGLDGLGILPKPSNLWDLIPLSFTINWITGVGANIRRAEYGLFLLAFPTYGVHSLTIEAGLPTKVANDLNLLADPNLPLRLRWYYRDVSTYIPLPQSGKYDFGLPTGSPPITLVASLLWQLLL